MLTLVLAVLPYLARLQRAAMIDVLESEYVQMARLKGVRERIVIRRHALRNSVVPIIQGSALTLIYLTGGIVTIEYLFAFPGLGSALTTAVPGRDLPVVQAIVLLFAPSYVVFNLLADVLTILLVPRLRIRREVSPPTQSRRATRRAGAAAATSARRMRRSLRFGRTRVGIALLGCIVLARAHRAVRRPARARRPRRHPAQTPSGDFPLGTDYLGHDVLSRVLWGGRSVVWMAFAAATLGVGVGAALGMLAGFSQVASPTTADARDGRHPGLPADRARAAVRLDARVEALADRGAGRTAWVPQVARVARGVTSDIVHREYVESAEVIGLPRRRILLREILPNVATPLMVEYGLRLTWSIALIAAISFLGFGIQPPNADWGLMINENRNISRCSRGRRRAGRCASRVFAIGTNFITEGISRAVAGRRAAGSASDDARSTSRGCASS